MAVNVGAVGVGAVVGAVPVHLRDRSFDTETPPYYAMSSSPMDGQHYPIPTQGGGANYHQNHAATILSNNNNKSSSSSSTPSPHVVRQLNVYAIPDSFDGDGAGTGGAGEFILVQ
jgi:hypothetical protein